MKIERTGKTIAFLDLAIGAPFWAHNRLWVRTDFSAATELHSTEIKDRTRRSKSVCNFLIDGTTKPKWGPYGHPNEVCELVEAVSITEI